MAATFRWAGWLLVSMLWLGACAREAPAPFFTPADPLQAEESFLPHDRFAELTQRLRPTVVNISVLRRTPERGWPGLIPWLTPPEPEPDSPWVPQEGSGVVLDEDGWILTNNHLVAEATEVVVSTHDEREFPAEVVGSDSGTDLALLKVADGPELQAATLGDSSAVRVGEWVMAIGNAFGLEESVTVGVISGKGRVLGAGPFDDFLQTDASINPGNSGGPLFNTRGEVIGVNTAILSGGEGIGFAIPSNLARQVAEDLRGQGRVVRGFIGVSIQKVTPNLRDALGLPEDLDGAVVSGVVPGGPAQRAGIQIGDVLLRVGSESIQDTREVVREVSGSDIGSRLPVLLYRDGLKRTVQVTVAERAAEQAVRVPPPEQGPPHPSLGVVVRDLDPEMAIRLGVMPRGALVIEVQPGGPAARAGLQSGDVIRRLGSMPIESAGQFLQKVRSSRGGPLALLVERDGEATFLVVRRGAEPR